MDEKNHDTQEQNKEARFTEDMEKSGSTLAKNSKESIHCLSIIGQIEGHYMLPEGQRRPNMSISSHFSSRSRRMRRWTVC